MRNYVIINGVNSLNINGLAINELPPITKPPMRTLIEEIDGRDGDIITDLGYGSYDKEMSIGLFQGYDIDEIIAFFNGEGTIIFSNEPDKYYKFKIVEQIDYEKLLKFKTAIITLHCQPFKYKVDETPIEVEYQYIEETGTNITLNSTADDSLSLELNPSELSQETTTGANLQKFNARTASTYNYSCDEKGQVIITTNNSSYVVLGYNFSTNPMTLTAGTYKLKVIGTIDTSKVSLLMNGTNNITLDANQEATITIANDTSSFYIAFGVQKETINADFYITLASGTTATTERYTGGIPQPNPEFPSQVHSVSGDNSIVLQNKNLLDRTKATLGKIIYKSGAMLNDTNSDVSDYIDVSGISSVVISFTTSLDSFSWGICCYDENKNALSDYGANGVGKSAAASGRLVQNLITNNIKYLRFSYPKNSTDVMLEVNTTKTSYLPHQEQVKPITLPVENLINVPDITLTGADYVFNLTNLTIPSGIYTFNMETPYSSLSVACTDKDNNDYFNTAKTFPFTINATNGIKTFRIYSNNSAGGTFKNIQLEEGSKANSYNSYGNPAIKYCKIGDYSDHFFKAVVGDEIYDSLDSATKETLTADKWYIQKNIGKVVLNGSENWDLQNVTSGNNYYTKINNALGYIYAPIYSNISKYKYFGSSEANVPQYSSYISAGKNLNFLASIFNSTTDLKTFLNTTNMIVNFILATSQYIPLNDTLQAELEDIKTTLVSYKGQTNISQINNDLAFIMTAIAREDGSDTGIIVNQGNIYSKPTLDIKGSGDINVSLNGSQLFIVDVEDEVVIDSANLEAYNPNTGELMNRNITGNISNLKLNKGTNTMGFSGNLEKATITDYSRWL